MTKKMLLFHTINERKNLSEKVTFHQTPKGKRSGDTWKPRGELLTGKKKRKSKGLEIEYSY